ncbi:D-amino-acid transaminase [Rhizobium hidalgonense]|uniref:Probable branched-chain-amino-acid aminotransferase n=1 Tax=Rhizobium hidalgonense TaxID=1538159 RepID=A0A2A6KH62_9HYPH|nr:D-amino-acid transaminase [Rhizobium hidalgonense]EJC72755.1 branched-chain amino acid aminotransferase/4-amino-4-deoxychorismate lyase [Rhizobium leguminosarum bv. trifolii WSM2012]MDR9774611.1 D-amino-acid transaminase [Rhizobium hidalgonense]MDR9809401.1 D-amino-acid transaminase [Rhizobium hidalgonense]MDR9820911.1 D-amino-acid transaminase [Rhizobium hidalgonense]PDT24124.1 D-amino-acid transaminase [Rhizobium hidalgonense]
MPRIAYVNGRYVKHSDASVHIEDRGYQFADGVYEVCEVRHGYIVDLTRHLNRLDRSLSELRITWPMGRAALTQVIRQTLRRNHVRDGLFYLQVTRGVARRDHVFPAEGTPPSLVITAKSTDPKIIAAKNANGIRAITVADNRWDRVDIKSIGLLPNAMARQQAKEAGAQEAIYVDADGMVKEGAATNVWIVDPDGTLVTRPAEHGILRGITRTTLMDVAARLGLKIAERNFSVSEMLTAREVFLTAATSICFPVVSVDGQAIANGHPGSVSQKVREAFFDVAEKIAI